MPTTPSKASRGYGASSPTATSPLDVSSPTMRKGASSPNALRAAGTATLRSPIGTESIDLTLKSPLGKSAANKTRKGLTELTRIASYKPVETVWDEKHIDEGDIQQKKLRSLTVKVDRMAGVFEEETMARHHQRELMDELHEDQMKRLNEISVELDQAMQQVKSQIDAFMQKYRTILGETFDVLHTELKDWVVHLTPRIEALEARGRVLRALIEEETEDRLEQNRAILLPAKDWCERLQVDLKQEENVRITRAADIQQRLEHATFHLEQQLDREIEARAKKQVTTGKDWNKEQDRLFRRQGEVDDVCRELIIDTNKEVTHENEHRILGQDPTVQALTAFMAQFHADIKEKAELG
eukprot:TRINITY_DN67102_c0_g1_i1.p1 TRINITY_DN67102_c0_g1~~TRINITY_DN67102_c0_g1_i1.p1  ORF type:complete len:354 (-),score=85.86 TRINITY_DN67102_c0_g1_i1:95-1156(-)